MNAARLFQALFLRLVLLLLLLTTTFIAAKAEEGAPTEPVDVKLPDDVSNLLQTLVLARSDLHSGIYRAVGRVVKRPHDGEAIETSCQLYSAFDSKTNRIRCDARGEWAVDVRSASSLTERDFDSLRDRTFKTSPSVRPYIFLFARTAEYYVDWSAIGNREDSNHATQHVQFQSADTSRRLPLMIVVNPSLAGLLEPRSLFADTTLDEIVARLPRRMREASVQQREGGVIQILFDADTFIRVVDIDTDHGFTPRRMSLKMRDADGVPKSEKEMIVSTADWELQNGAWVPVRISTGHTRSKGMSSFYEFDFDWVSVNPEQIDQKEFDYHSFSGVWDGAKVLDMRNNAINHIDTINAEFKKIPFRDDTPEFAQSTERTQIRAAVLLLNTVVLALGTYIWYRRKLSVRQPVSQV